MIPPPPFAPEIRQSRPVWDAAGIAVLGARWRQVEAEAGASFFQSWAWVGCQAAQRYPDPVLLEAWHQGALIGLALFNRRRRWHGPVLHLHESGDSVRDSVFIEHNGLLLTGPRDQQVLTSKAMLDALPWRSGLVLSGISKELAELARQGRRRVVRQQVRMAPFVDLAAVPIPGSYAAQLSRNTRQQLSRSQRAYEATGPLTVTRAGTVGQAMAFFEAMCAWHVSAWAARGRPGAFAGPEVLAFHHALIRDGVVAGSVDLLQISAGGRAFGYLYNFVRDGQVSAYQSGFDYDAASPHQKPGLTSHAAAIEWCRARGDTRYDFLAGDSRYKRSLAGEVVEMQWVACWPRWHPLAIAARLRASGIGLAWLRSRRREPDVLEERQNQ